MAVVTGSAEAWAERNKNQAEQLLRILVKGKSPGATQMLPSAVAGDHPRPQGLFASALFGLFVWPEDSETELTNLSETEGQYEKFRDQQADDVHAYRNAVFTSGVWQGEGADAADGAHADVERALSDDASAARLAKKLFAQAAADVERTKRFMTRENDAMHAEIEKLLCSGTGQSLAQIAVIIGTHRAAVQVHSADLHAYSGQYTTQLLGNFPLTPQGGSIKPAGAGTDSPTDPAPNSPPSNEGRGRRIGDHGQPSGGPLAKGSPGLPPPTDGPVPLSPLPGQGVPSPLGSGGGLPMSGLPGMPGGGGGSGSPLSGLQGMFSGLGSPPSMPMPATGLGSPTPPTPATAGMDFGRGLAAGMTAAGGAAGAPIGPIPQAPNAPLAAPATTTPAVAAPAAAAAAVPASPAPATATPAAAGMTPYGSLLQPAPPVGPTPGPVPTAPGIPTETGGPAASAAGAGLVPAVAGGRDAAAVSRDDSASDIELAKLAVAELAGASCVIDAGLDWAVAVGHNRSGATTLWVATNDGACYIPPGVFLRHGMVVAAGFDDDFDARWLGWSNPAEKAVRAARAYGDKVGAVATTWAWPSQFLEDPDNGVRQLAIGVSHAGPDGPASELRRTRMHRLQTINPSLYADLKAPDESTISKFCRELTSRIAFGAGPALSPAAQAVANRLVAGGWPQPEEWVAVNEEYESERLMMAAQRPGLHGLEDSAQVVSYQHCYVNARRLETLLSWKRSDPLMPADVVYAAWVAGARASVFECVT